MKLTEKDFILTVRTQDNSETEETDFDDYIVEIENQMSKGKYVVTILPLNKDEYEIKEDD